LVGKRTVLGTTQVIPEINIRGTTLVIGTTEVILYTVPANKKALIKKACFESNGGGANTLMTVRIVANSVFEISTTNQDSAVNAGTMPNQELDAGDTINIIGDSGANNGAAEFTITIQETPA